jgi:hypothetical protein
LEDSDLEESDLEDKAMQTEDLVEALAADHGSRSAAPGRVLALALVAGVATAAGLFALMLGPRPDIAEAISTPRFLLKFVETSALAATAIVLALQLMRPGAPNAGATVALIIAPAILMTAVVVEMVLVPSDVWSTRLVGSNSRICLTFIPLLSMPLLVAAMLAMQHGAPTRPRLAGAVAGLVAGGLAATLYAAHCTDDSPLFVATWYTIAIGAVAFAGSLAGPRVLRW